MAGRSGVDWRAFYVPPMALHACFIRTTGTSGTGERSRELRGQGVDPTSRTSHRPQCLVGIPDSTVRWEAYLARRFHHGTTLHVSAECADVTPRSKQRAPRPRPTLSLGELSATRGRRCYCWVIRFILGEVETNPGPPVRGLKTPSEGVLIHPSRRRTCVQLAGGGKWIEP